MTRLITASLFASLAWGLGLSAAVAEGPASPPGATGGEVKAEEADPKVIQPFGVFAGGLRFEKLQLREGETKQSRNPTVAVSRVGIKGHWGDHIRFKSEFEANIGGPLGYGASVWEGQAALSVRDQYLEYDRWGLQVAAGRVTDTATVDFFSAHVADVLATDVYTRDALLYSGYDRGTGLFAKYRITPNLKAGLTFHSTNPTGITGTLLIGGDLFPYSRPFYLAAAQVARNEFTLPDQNLHLYFGTPSIEYEDEFLEFKTAVQAYQLDTQMSTDEDARIVGYNIRASARAKLLGGRLVPFANVSRNENEMLDPMDATVKLEDTYRAYTYSGGVDYNYLGNSGVGVQFAQVRQRDGDGSDRVLSYLNVGHTLWVEKGLSLGLRYAAFFRDDSKTEDQVDYLGLSADSGHQSVFVTGRLIL